MKKLLATLLVISLLILTIVCSIPVSSSKISEERMAQIKGAWNWWCSLKLAAYGAAIAGAVLSVLASGGAVLITLLSYGGAYALAAMDLLESGCIPWME